MATQYLVRRSTAFGAGNGRADACPIYCDSDTNTIKAIPAGTGTTEVELCDLSTAQTLTNKTLTSPSISGGTISSVSLNQPVVAANVYAATAAGSTAGDAGAIGASGIGIVLVSAADTTKGVKLPAATAGTILLIKNSVTNKVLKVYPATGETINALTANTSLDMANGTPALFACHTAGAWFTIPLLPS